VVLVAGDPTVHRDGPGYRDTATSLGRLLPTAPAPQSCPGCHRLADVIDELRQSNEWLVAELAKVNVTLAAISKRGNPSADAD
jgi:hypothetical protein